MNDHNAPSMRAPVQAAFDDILDTFSGGDGGVRFTNLLVLLRGLDERASQGDQSAQELIQIMLRFRRLIQVANKENAT
jgi:hypothetical protein